MEAKFVLLDDREEASALAAELAARQLHKTLEQAGKASFMASGGSSPGPMYTKLSGMALDWKKVTIGLVDERWVPPDHPASNEKLVRSRLLRGAAAAAEFLPMKTDARSPADAVDERASVYAPHCAPISCVLLGMGPDGHAASWFPGSDGLSGALDSDSGRIISAIDASGSPVAGEHGLRMTLAAGPVCGAETGILLFFGDDKRVVLEQSLKGDELEFPVRKAIQGLGGRLTIIWAP